MKKHWRRHRQAGKRGLLLRKESFPAGTPAETPTRSSLPACFLDWVPSTTPLPGHDSLLRPKLPNYQRLCLCSQARYNVYPGGGVGDKEWAREKLPEVTLPSARDLNEKILIWLKHRGRRRQVVV